MAMIRDKSGLNGERVLWKMRVTVGSVEGLFSVLVKTGGRGRDPWVFFHRVGSDVSKNDKMII